MDDLFYRKEKTSSSLKQRVSKLLKRKRFWVTLVGVLLLISFSVFGDRGIVQRMKLLQQKADLQVKLVRAEEELELLKAESKGLDTDKKAIEKAAREKYGMVREGETVYKIKRSK